MSGKIKISFMVMIWSIIALQIFVNYREDERRVISAFSVVDDNVTGETIKGYGYYKSMPEDSAQSDTGILSDTAKKKILENLAGELGITDGYSISGGTGDGFDKVVLTKNGKHAVTKIQMVSLMDKLGVNESPEYYISIEINISENMKQAVKLYHKVKDVYDDNGMKSSVSLEVNIRKKGDYVSLKGSGIYEDIFKLVKAKKVDEIMENGICTVYGYTKEEREHLILNNKKVNIQVVLSYDEKEDVTYVKVGMPIVNSSY